MLAKILKTVTDYVAKDNKSLFITNFDISTRFI